MAKEVSRRRYANVMKMLNQAVSNDSLPWAQRFRAAELVICINQGVLLPGWTSNKRDRKTIKELLQERDLEKSLQKSLAEDQSKSRAAEEARAFLAKVDQRKAGQ